MRFKKYVVLADEKMVKKSLAKYPESIKEQVKKAIEDLQYHPPKEVKPLKNMKGKLYRKKVGDMRIVFLAVKSKKAVMIVKIGHRKEIYEDLKKAGY